MCRLLFSSETGHNTYIAFAIVSGAKHQRRAPVMSRTFKAIAAAAIIPAGIAAATLSGAGAASAALPYSGSDYAGIVLDNGETAFAGQWNIGNALESIPSQYWYVELGDGSVHGNDGGDIYATVDELIDETVAQGGYVAFELSVPKPGEQRFITLYQEW